MKKLVTALLLFVFQFIGAQNNFNMTESKQFQEQLNVEYKDAKTSPLTDSDLKHFEGLDFYPISEKYFVNAKLVKSKGEKPFEMATSTTRKPKYIKYGTLYFSIDGEKLQLNVYRDVELSKKAGFKDHLFLPFSDLTSGKESYVGGKYIDLKIPKGEDISIDFNQSYNPYCAYNHKYSCPLVPLENDLNVAIRAGVKKYHD